MTYRALIIESEEGFAAFCPALPGCVSQGESEAEALDNLREAAWLWLDSGGVAAADGGASDEDELLREAKLDGLVVRAHEIGLAVAA